MVFVSFESAAFDQEEGKKKGLMQWMQRTTCVRTLYSKRAKSKAIAVVLCMRSHVTSWKKGSAKVVLAQEQRVKAPQKLLVDPKLRESCSDNYFRFAIMSGLGGRCHLSRSGHLKCTLLSAHSTLK